MYKNLDMCIYILNVWELQVLAGKEHSCQFQETSWNSGSIPGWETIPLGGEHIHTPASPRTGRTGKQRRLTGLQSRATPSTQPEVTQHLHSEIQEHSRHVYIWPDMVYSWYADWSWILIYIYIYTLLNTGTSSRYMIIVKKPTLTRKRF